MGGGYVGKWGVGVAGRILCWREDVGFGSASRQVNLDQALEVSTKAAVTDARKRCLRLFGEALGGGINDHELQTELKEHVKAERYAKQKADAEAAALARSGGAGSAPHFSAAVSGQQGPGRPGGPGGGSSAGAAAFAAAPVASAGRSDGAVQHQQQQHATGQHHQQQHHQARYPAAAAAAAQAGGVAVSAQVTRFSVAELLSAPAQ